MAILLHVSKCAGTLLCGPLVVLTKNCGPYFHVCGQKGDYIYTFCDLLSSLSQIP